MDDLYDYYGGWETLDTEALLARRDEATAMGNVGPYTVPLGTDPLRREIPVGRPRRQPYWKDRASDYDDNGDRAPYWGPNMHGEDPLAKRMY